MDPFQVLGVDHDATPDEIRSAYRALVRDLHPDTRSPALDGAAADEALRRVQWAYRSVAENRGPAARFPATERFADGRGGGGVHDRVRRFPWWIVAIALLMAIFIVTAYAGSVPVSSP